MEEIIIQPTYFPSISHYVAMIHAEKIWLETDDNFQKQTNRNRMYIYSPNGKQLLNIPIKHSVSNERQKTKDVKIEWAFDWQKQHFKSLEAAYRSSPFFEYFEDELITIFESKPKYLLDLNIQTFEIVNQCMGLSLNVTPAVEFKKTTKGIKDFRNLALGKKDVNKWEPYHQVFKEKHGFLNNLSILDLLFNEGRQALSYLRAQESSLQLH
jgi:hypothetical protein